MPKIEYKRANKKSAFDINHIEQSSFSDVKVFSSGYERVSSLKEPRELNDFGSYSIHFVLSGAGTIEMLGKAHAVCANQIFFIFPDTPVKYYPEKAHPWRYSWMDFYGSKVQEILARLGVSPQNPVIDAPPELGKYFLANVSECMNYPKNSDFISISKFYTIVAELMKTTQSEDADAKNRDKEIVDKSMRFIDNNFADPSFGLDFLASAVGLNSAYLSRLIKKQIGINFTSLLTRKRLTKAVLLIDEGEDLVSRISYEVGFSDPYYFSKVFKKTYGMTPRDYIGQVKEKKNARG